MFNVAVNEVLLARGLAGVNVAIWLVALYVTTPSTLTPPGPVNVKVVALMLFGSIAWLNFAVITALLGQTKAEPSIGLTEITVGSVESNGHVDAFVNVHM